MPAIKTIAAGSTGSSGTTPQVDPLDGCYQSTWGFTWIMCPVLQGIDGVISFFGDFVNNQLNFPDSYLKNSDLRTSWNIIKNIATGLLVAILLLAVFAQAVGGGPLDPYTIRKMLPRIVVAIILMQISWYMLGWFIDLANALGKGIESLLLAPFGGSGNLGLDKLVANTLPPNAASQIAANIGTLFLITAAVAATIINPFWILTLALVVFLAFATAFIVLVIRKVLIVMLLVLAPLAFILWILPGTDRYWKMWRENFTKLLLMYPLIMGLIAAGQIAAFLAANTQPGAAIMLHSIHQNGIFALQNAKATDFVQLAVVIATYFAPFFLLPKTFSWGGQIMGLAGNAVQRGFAKPFYGLSKKGIDEAKGQYQGRMARRYSPDQSLGQRALNRLGSGHYLPTEKSRQDTLKTGEKYIAEQRESAEAYLRRVGEQARDEGYTTYERNSDGSIKTDASGQPIEKPLVGVAAMKQRWVDLTESDNHTLAMQAVKQLVKSGSWPELEGSFTQGGKRVSELDIWREAVTTDPELYPAINGKMPLDAPHMMESRYSDSKRADFKARYGIDVPAGMNGQFLTEEHRMLESLDQLNPQDLPNLPPAYWQRVTRLANKVDPATNNLTPDSQAVANELSERLSIIAQTPGAGQFNVSQLNSGAMAREINRALGNAAHPTSLQTLLGIQGGATERVVYERLGTSAPKGYQADATPAEPSTLAPPAPGAPASPEAQNFRRGVIGDDDAVSRSIASNIASNITFDPSTRLPVAMAPDLREAIQSSLAGIKDEIAKIGGSSAQAGKNYNATVDKIHKAIDDRYNKIINDRITEGRPLDSDAVDRLRDITETEKSKYEKLP